MPKEDSIDEAIERLVDGVGREMFSRIVRRTPVNTGQARDGWEYNKTGEGESTGFEITNEVEHVIYLEEGTVKTSAVGMVRTTLEETDQIVRQIINSM